MGEAHLKILKTIESLNFNVGKKLLTEILLGDATARILKLKLNKNYNFSCLESMNLKNLEDLLDVMIFNKLIEFQALSSNKFIKILKVTDRGQEELNNPKIKLNDKKGISRYYDNIEVVTEDDKIKFKLLDSFLNDLNDEQKKAVILNNDKILCIAGAGSGKTKTLIKKIEYLVKYKSIPQNKILAITFTRKARQEMMLRLDKSIPNHNIKIETFNSFCEKILKKYGSEIYDKPCKVLDFKLQSKVFVKALQILDISIDTAINTYFTDKKLKSKDRTTLFFSLMNDVFAIKDYYSNRWQEISELKHIMPDFSYDDKRKAEMIYKILKEIDKLKKQYSIRDFTDQIVHTIQFFKKNKTKIPEFEYILIDEYQDINDLQIELIDLLNPKNLFVVGDPRQSIYGWRNAKIEHILGFNTKYENAKIIQLNKNYRSTADIIELSNQIIKPLKLPDLIPIKEQENNSVMIIKHDSEESETTLLVHSIKAQKIKRNNIFILARTNRQLENVSQVFKTQDIKHIIKSSDIQNKTSIPKEDEVVLSTVHAIKGLEAELVYVIGSNNINFPCKASEHPVLELIKAGDEYNKNLEELRLFYVAVTRAKTRVVISYSGTLTKFIPRIYLEDHFPNHLKNKSLNNFFSSNNKDEFTKLRDWRRDIAKVYNIPAFRVLSDKVLMQIAKVKPKDFVELEAIPGMGTININKYGDDILDIINS